MHPFSATRAFNERKRVVQVVVALAGNLLASAEWTNEWFSFVFSCNIEACFMHETLADMALNEFSVIYCRFARAAEVVCLMCSIAKRRDLRFLNVILHWIRQF